MRWQPHEIEILRKRYPNEVTSAIAQDLGRDIKSLYAKAYKLGLKKSDAFMSSVASGRIFTPNKATQFKKGNKPWNTGLKGWTAGGRSAETRFKKGQDPHNTVPVGSYRITKDGTLQRKINNKSGSNSVRWRSVQELVWIEANGPVPPKHLIVFKPGMKTNVLEEITLDKIECVSFAENMKRNSVHNYPPEIKAAIRSLAVLNRKINHEQKHR